MKLRYLEALMLILTVTVALGTMIVVTTLQQREIEHLNRDLMEARQEIAQKMNRLYEVSHEMELLRTKMEDQK